MSEPPSSSASNEENDCNLDNVGSNSIKKRKMDAPMSISNASRPVVELQRIRGRQSDVHTTTPPSSRSSSPISHPKNAKKKEEEVHDEITLNQVRRETKLYIEGEIHQFYLISDKESCIRGEIHKFYLIPDRESCIRGEFTNFT
jgi:hypothetical protein